MDNYERLMLILPNKAWPLGRFIWMDHPTNPPRMSTASFMYVQSQFLASPSIVYSFVCTFAEHPNVSARLWSRHCQYVSLVTTWEACGVPLLHTLYPFCMMLLSANIFVSLPFHLCICFAFTQARLWPFRWMCSVFRHRKHMYHTHTCTHSPSHIFITFTVTLDIWHCH